MGTVRDGALLPLRHAAVTVMDNGGRQLVRAATNARGEYAVGGLPEGDITVVAVSPTRRPQVQRLLLEQGSVVRADFTLYGRSDGDAPSSPALSARRGAAPRN
ncbi:carboxypeptidase-like regulatory domain-containing protein [Streptomyces kaempferi]